MNILSKKFKEIFLNPKLKISGKWNIAVVHENGKENFVFGKKMKSNLILNQGLDILASSKYYTSYNGLNWNTIPAFLFGGAQCGIGTNAALETDTSLENLSQYTKIVNDFSCEVVDDLITGTRVYKKIYDFPQLQSGTLPIREIGITTPWFSENNEEKIFSRFLLPSPVNLARNQFIRLFYEFSIQAPTVTALPIQIGQNSSYSNFNPNGNIILAGRYADIFGSFDNNGFMKIDYGDSPRGSFLPYWDKFCLNSNDNIEDCERSCYGTSYMIEDLYENLNINSPIISQWAGKRSSLEDNTIEASTYVSGNFYRDVTYIFDKNNPLENTIINGFLFTITRSDRENTIDGWFWELNNEQMKYIDKKLVITLRQSVVR